MCITSPDTAAEVVPEREEPSAVTAKEGSPTESEAATAGASPDASLVVARVRPRFPLPAAGALVLLFSAYLQTLGPLSQ
ncbi:hypothetical protein HPB47_008606 [Ixodes persulcatus]|uniref:Uncharacterized protein n=1 Tax=Ixodes persulcatus TaxID=34615 RepID=A0AC60P4G1_IXOPE|nr:hypothetical protein HPB47_008606 [Ixodes persulcatus]